jgi:hypothetical protein
MKVYLRAMEGSSKKRPNKEDVFFKGHTSKSLYVL